MKLTSELLADAPSYINPLGDRVLKLRSHGISDISALTQISTSDIFECVDLTDNDLIVVPVLPENHRVKTLLLARNRIRLFDDNFAAKMYNLETISLMNNFVRAVEALESLRSASSLTNLCLAGNPVASLPNFRLWCVHRFPGVKVLDFQKVSDEERKKAHRMFGTVEKPTKKAAKMLKSVQEGEDVKESINSKEVAIKASIQRLSAKQKKELKAQLAAATSIADIRRIEGVLERGYV